MRVHQPAGFLLVLMATLAPLRAQQPGASRQADATPEFNPRRVVAPLKPIVGAPVVSAKEVADQVSPEELVLGVVVENQARAYPINMLTGPTREIINDTLGGRAIAATW